jgi:hypothetical protein
VPLTGFEPALGLSLEQLRLPGYLRHRGILAGLEGIEPPLTVLETAVLPLN